MKENFSIKSKIISGTVTKTDCENGANIVIDIKIHGDISPDCVVRAYFAERDTKELKPVGIVDNFGHLAVFMQNSDCTDTVVFGIKNTITDKVDYVGYAYSACNRQRKKNSRRYKKRRKLHHARNSSKNFRRNKRKFKGF